MNEKSQKDKLKAKLSKRGFDKLVDELSSDIIDLLGFYHYSLPYEQYNDLEREVFNLVALKIREC